MNIKYVEMSNSKRAVPRGFIGHTNPNEVIEVTVHVRRKRSEAELDAFIARVKSGQAKPLTAKQFARKFGANQADVSRLCRFASANGLTVVDTHLGMRTVKLAGTVEDMKKAFQTDIGDVQHTDGLVYRSRTGSYSLPANLSRVVVSILGFTGIPKAATRHRLLAAEPHEEAAQRLSYSGAQVLQGYGIKLKTRGKGHTLWIGQLGGGYRQKDLDAYAAKYGLPKINIMASSVDGAKNSPSNSNSADTEVMMDIEIPYSMVPEALFEVAFAPNSGRGFADLILHFAHKSKAVRGTVSWGLTEDHWEDHERLAMNAAFKDCTAMGKTCANAAGDDGSSDGVNDGKDHCDYPGSDPEVSQLVIGGTNTVIVDGVLKSERVWNNGRGRGATGGGVSRKFPKPDYQADLAIKSADGTYEGRLVPDVASPGDPTTGYTVYVDGDIMTVGGTSAGSPFWCGLQVGIDAERANLGKKPLSALKLDLYKNRTLFRDVVDGDNGSYKAGPGYDCCTGWGTPTQQLVDALVAA